MTMESSKTLVLPSGAKLTVTVDVDLFAFAPADRDLVFGIIDRARQFINDAEAAVDDLPDATLGTKEADRG